MATIWAIVTVDSAWRFRDAVGQQNYNCEAVAVWSGTSMAPIFAG
jgi:hypothetical protein